MTLPIFFKKNGFIYQQIKRAENLAIYSQKSPGFNFEYFEVIKVQVVKSDVTTKFMTLKAGTEFYPSINSWGVNGWTCGTLQRAEEKLNELIQIEKNKK